MTKERLSTFFLVFAFATLLAMLAYRREMAAQGVSTRAANPGGLQNLASMSPASYLNYNWGAPPHMAYFMPQVTQGGEQSPLPSSNNYGCGGC